MSTGYIPIWDEESQENILVAYEDLDPELAERLRMVPPIGGFCYDAENFKDLPLTPAPYFVGNGWLPKQGKVEIFGPPKKGKSFLALQLARCIGAGVPFLGLPTKKGRVLYLQFELGVEVLQKRMRDTMQVYPNVIVGTTFSMKLDKKPGQDFLRVALDAINPDVLILDPFVEIFSGDENKAQDIGILKDFINDIIDAYQCSVVLIHHTGKDESKGGRGSIVLEGWVDSYIRLKSKSKKGEPLKIELEPLSLRHAQLPAENIVAQFVDGEFELIGKDNKPTSIISKVWEYSEHHDEFKSAEIMSAKLGSRAAVQAALNQLIDNTDLERHKPGWYRKINKE